jgi:hypothetical protein
MPVPIFSFASIASPPLNTTYLPSVMTNKARCGTPAIRNPMPL